MFQLDCTSAHHHYISGLGLSGPKYKRRDGNSDVLIGLPHLLALLSVAAALFSFGRSDSRPNGRGPQWQCQGCSWQNDLKRQTCRHWHNEEGIPF